MHHNDIEEYIQELIRNAKGDYICQTVTFKKDNENHINLLRFVLANSRNISAFYRHLIEDKAKNSTQNIQESPVNTIQDTPIPSKIIEAPVQKTPVKNFPKEPLKLQIKQDKPKQQDTTSIQGFF